MNFKDLLIDRVLLNEKQILFNNGAKYNQAVFLAGGTASGKSFAVKHFMEGEKFRVFDVDRWKEQYLKLAKATERYPEISGLDLQNPDDVSKLHKFVKDKGIHNKFIQNVVLDAEPGRLPNVMFDVTLKSIGKLDSYLPLLNKAGYSDRNIHLVWVLTDYSISIRRNRKRKRVVPEDIVLNTHEGAASTMTKFINQGLPTGMNGSVHIILNNPEHTVTYEDGEDIIIKDFEYLTVKNPGKKMKNSKELKKQLAIWMKKNVPRTTEMWKNLEIH